MYSIAWNCELRNCLPNKKKKGKMAELKKTIDFIVGVPRVLIPTNTNPAYKQPMPQCIRLSPDTLH